MRIVHLTFDTAHLRFLVSRLPVVGGWSRGARD